MHREGYVHAGEFPRLQRNTTIFTNCKGRIIPDVKADNILVNEKLDQTNRFTDVQLADMGNSYPETHEYALEGQPIGAPMWTSPEVLMHMPWDTKTDIWSFGTLVSPISTSLILVADDLISL